MSRIISYEEACALTRVWDDIDIANTPIFKEAEENGNANLDSRPDDYETLYDLCREINIRKEDNFEFPVDCLQKIKIYK